MESRGCGNCGGCGCGNCGGCGGGGGRRMGNHAGSRNMDLTDDEMSARLRSYKEDLAEEIKFIDKRIADLESGDASKSGK